MIANNDNTAADHLIHFLGRKRVEMAQKEMRVAHPELNVPFLTNSEYIAFKASAPGDLVSDYVDGSTTDRRAILANQVPSIFVDDMDVAMLTIPKTVGTIGWFASMTDLCNIMNYLHVQSMKPGMDQLTDILFTDAGPLIRPDQWAHAGIMIECNDPGASGAVEILQRIDGRWFVIAGVLNDSTNAIQVNPMGIDFISPLRLLAKTP